MTSRSPDVQSLLAVDEEVRTAAGLIRLGLAAVQATGPANDFYHLPMLLLGQGFERLGKLALLLWQWEEQGSGQPIRKYGHRLNEIMQDVGKYCFPADYSRWQGAEDDLRFLQSDPVLRTFLDVLHTFANDARYWDLDSAGSGVRTNNCQWLWTQARDALVIDDPEIQRLLVTADGAAAGYWNMNQKVVVVFERLARALARLFRRGALGDTGRSLGVPLHLFYGLTTDDLGTRDYRQDQWRAAAIL